MKDKTKQNTNNSDIINNFYIFIIFFMIIISFPASNQNKLDGLMFDSVIILTIIGRNNQQILNDKTIYSNSFFQFYKFDNKPSEILVNGEKINKIDYYVYNLKEE